MVNKRNESNEDRNFQREWEDSLKVSSYADKILEAIESGRSVEKNIVPDLSRGGGGKNHSYGNESGTIFSIDPKENDYMFRTAASALGITGLKSAAIPKQEREASAPERKSSDNSPDRPQLKLSSNQLRALKKYPSLIEFLGSDNGDQIAKAVVVQVNKILVDKIEENSKSAHKLCSSVEAAGQNFNAYFVGENESWVCRVITSGPFRGDEAVYYNEKEDKSYILRKSGDDWTNITQEFNVVHEFARKGE